MKRKTFISASFAAVLILGAAGTAAFGFSEGDDEEESDHDVISNENSSNDIPEDEKDESTENEDVEHFFDGEGDLE